MSFDDRIKAALAVIQEHNEVLKKDNLTGLIDPVLFIGCLKASGATSEDRLAQLSHEDILECLPADPVHNIKPKLLAKSLAKIFRNKTEIESVESPRISVKKADKMTVRELVQFFDPEDATNPVAMRLKEIVGDLPFIVYSEGRAVNVEITFKLLQEIRNGYGARSDYDLNGQVVKVYALGELPDNYADENPFYHNRPLRPDGTCDQSGRSWDGISLAIRQFIRVAIQMGELGSTIDDVHKTLDFLMAGNSLEDNFKKLKLRYRGAAVKFAELEKLGKLPTLKISLGNEESKSFPEGKLVNPRTGARIFGPMQQNNVSWKKK